MVVRAVERRSATRDRDAVGLAHTELELVGHRTQQLVTGFVPKFVVHLLEAIKVDEHQGERHLAALRGRAGPYKVLGENLAVRRES